MVTMTTLKDHEEWLKNRINGIGGSEIACVIGMNPFMSNQELYKIKRGITHAQDISDEPFVKYGTEAERHMKLVNAAEKFMKQVERVKGE